MAEQSDRAQLAAELHAEQDAAAARLTDMKLTDDEAHVTLSALAFSAPAAFQRALDLVQRHRDAAGAQPGGEVR